MKNPVVLTEAQKEEAFRVIAKDIARARERMSVSKIEPAQREREVSEQSVPGRTPVPFITGNLKQKKKTR